MDKLTYEFESMQGESRLRELILYVSNRCQNDPYFGATKLNKILFHSDFDSYKLYGVPVTGVRYMRLPAGPAPRPLVPVREAMITRGELALQKSRFFNHNQTRPIALRDAVLSEFSAQDMDIVNRVIERLWHQDASTVSSESHTGAWRIVKEKQDIPYESVYISDGPLTVDDIEWAHQIVREQQLDA